MNTAVCALEVDLILRGEDASGLTDFLNDLHCDVAENKYLDQLLRWKPDLDFAPNTPLEEHPEDESSEDKSSEDESSEDESSEDESSEDESSEDESSKDESNEDESSEVPDTSVEFIGGILGIVCSSFAVSYTLTSISHFLTTFA